MVASTGKTGRGIPFQIGNGATPTEVFATVANVSSISLTGEQGAEIDFTHLLSDGGYREFQQGFKDPGNIQLTLHFDPDQASQERIQELWQSGDYFNWQIPLTPKFDKVISGRGWIMNPGELTVDSDNPMQLQVTIRRSGPTTIEDA